MAEEDEEAAIRVMSVMSNVMVPLTMAVIILTIMKLQEGCKERKDYNRTRDRSSGSQSPKHPVRHKKPPNPNPKFRV